MPTETLERVLAISPLLSLLKPKPATLGRKDRNEFDVESSVRHNIHFIAGIEHFEICKLPCHKLAALSPSWLRSKQRLLLESYPSHIAEYNEQIQPQNLDWRCQQNS